MNATMNAVNTLTVKENIVYKFSLGVCLVDYCTDVKEIASECVMPVPVIKGVVGSLVKKGVMVAITDDRDNIIFNDLMPYSPDGEELVSYGNENLTEDALDVIRAYLEK